MSEKKTYYSTVTNGKLGQRVTKEIAAQLQHWEGKRIVLEMKIKRNTRSLNQNRYYFGCIVATLKDCILDMWGEEIDTEQAHEMLKNECNYKERVNESTGEILKLPLTTTELTTTEFEEYQERCRKFIYSFFNTQVPLPNTQAAIDYEQ